MPRISMVWGGLLRAVAILALTSGLFTVGAQLLPSFGRSQVAGKILSVDLQKQTLKLETEQRAGSVPLTQPMVFALTDKTVVTEDGRKAEPKDLRTGESVRIEYAIKEGKNVAHSITVEPAEGAAPR